MSDYNQVHSKRFQESLRWIAPHADKAKTILELGGESAFGEMLEKRWPWAVKVHCLDNLIYGFELGDTVDLILCMEVLEHLQDRKSVV